MMLAGVGASVSWAQQKTISYLADVQDRFHKAYDVYTDADAAGNHFASRGRFPASVGDVQVPPMNEVWSQSPRSGVTAIEAKFNSTQFGTGDEGWGGWYFLNGVLAGSEVSPGVNWGEHANAGVDLRGARRLTFWARGANGGERVEFFAFGVGNTKAPWMPCPDSAKKVSLGYVKLSSDWRKFTIDVSKANLRYVLGGFGWVTSVQENDGRDITFYLDDIQYDKPRLDEARFLVSFQTISSSESFDTVLRNVAYTYDNAAAAIAFLAAGQAQRAKRIVDALVYAQSHDRYYKDGRLRNAYQAGDLVLPKGWTPNGRVGTVRMPGWYDVAQATWYEDEFQVSTNTGNMAWAMLSLVAYYEKQGGRKYLDAALKLGQWVQRNCRDTNGIGYTGGYQGWEPSASDSTRPRKLTFKSTEHNIDLASAFGRLYALTGQAVWQERASSAKQFVISMWDGEGGKFWTGTQGDGVTPNKTVVPLDVQAWGVLLLRKKYIGALDYAEKQLRVGQGYDFSQTDLDGVWFEGTSQMASAYRWMGNKIWSDQLIKFVAKSSTRAGGVYAADRDGLTTGFDLEGRSEPWLYYHRVHVGATAWLTMAAYGMNPFVKLPR